MKRKSHRRILSTLMLMSPNFQWISPSLIRALPSATPYLSLPSSMTLHSNGLIQLLPRKCNKPLLTPRVDHLKPKRFLLRKAKKAAHSLLNSRNNSNHQTLNLACQRLNMAASSLLFRKGRAHLGIYRITSNIKDSQHKFRTIKQQ